jgi:hypothetical protein
MLTINMFVERKRMALPLHIIVNLITMRSNEPEKKSLTKCSSKKKIEPTRGGQYCLNFASGKFSQ